MWKTVASVLLTLAAVCALLFTMCGAFFGVVGLFSGDASSLGIGLLGLGCAAIGGSATWGLTRMVLAVRGNSDGPGGRP